MDASQVAARYRRFADVEARERSPLYAAISRGIATDREVLDFLLTFPQEKQQPNLLLAAVRHLFGTPADWSGFRDTLLANRNAIAALMRSRPLPDGVERHAVAWTDPHGGSLEWIAA